MVLEQFLDFFNDSLHIVLVDRDDAVLGEYDGRNSIDPIYNDSQVCYAQPDWDRHYLRVEIEPAKKA